MVVDLTREIGVLLLGRFEHHLGAIGEFVRGEVDFSKAALANEALDRVVADSVEIGRGELVKQGLVGVGELRSKDGVSKCRDAFCQESDQITLLRCSACSYSACVLMTGGIKCDPVQRSPAFLAPSNVQPTIFPRPCW